MKTTSVSIKASGDKLSFRLNGKFIAMESLAKKCNISMSKLRRIVGLSKREKIINGFVLQTEAGLQASCKTFWRRNVPMWVQLVTRETGVCKDTALSRIRQWQKDGDYDRLMRHGSLQEWYINWSEK